MRSWSWVSPVNNDVWTSASLTPNFCNNRKTIQCHRLSFPKNELRKVRKNPTDESNGSKVSRWFKLGLGGGQWAMYCLLSYILNINNTYYIWVWCVTGWVTRYSRFGRIWEQLTLISHLVNYGFQRAVCTLSLVYLHVCIESHMFDGIMFMVAIWHFTVAYS